MAYAFVARAGIAGALRRRNAAPIFCFHNVIPDGEAAPADRSLHLDRSTFAEMVGWLARSISVIPLAELASRLRSGRTVRGAACVTFDDAYRGTIRHALPLLRRHALPATVFVVASAAERPAPFWWDTVPVDEHARERFLLHLRGDADEIRKSAGHTPPRVTDDFLPADWTLLRASFDSDITAGSHTLSHRNLSALEPAERRRELLESRETIGSRLGCDIPFVSYPYGFATPEVMDASAAAGYAGAVTLGFGRANAAHHPHALPRVNVPAGLPLAAFESWASGLRLRPAPIRIAPKRRGTVPPGRFVAD